jgi:phosphoribosylglycinamide formyltransferase-1
MSNDLNVAVFASGGGSNFQALIDKKDEGKLHAAFAVCVGNNSNAKAFERARNHTIPTLHIAPGHFENENAYTERLLSELESRTVDLIVLAGYMKKIPVEVIRRYQNRIINIHPALLPSFGGQGMYGKRVHQTVLDYGAKVTGITVHFVDEEYDKGPIILQETAPVLDDDDADSLAARVLNVEHANYWRAVEAIAQGTITVKGRRVIGSV